MSLRTKIKIDPNKSSKGVKFNLTDYPNEDGTIPSFHLLAGSRHNISYQKAMREIHRDITESGKIEIKDDGTVGKVDDTYEAEITAAYDKALISNVVVGWENFEPDKAGVKEPFSTEKAVEILTSIDWVELLDMVKAFVANNDNYRHTQKEKNSKN